MDTIKINKKNTLMVAHRGLSGIEKENTLASFIAACNRSYFGCECDIHKTKDDKYVVIHDSDVYRVAGISLIIENSTLEEIRNIRLIDFNKQTQELYFVPTLEEYITTLKRYDKKCIIEYKNSFKKEDVKEVLDIIEALGYLDSCIFISFDINNLLFTKKIKKELPCQYLMVEPIDEKIDNAINNDLGLDIYYQYLTKEIVDKFHSHNLKVNAWTVDEKDAAEKLVDMGVDFITTNILE